MRPIVAMNIHHSLVNFDSSLLSELVCANCALIART